MTLIVSPKPVTSHANGNDAGGPSGFGAEQSSNSVTFDPNLAVHGDIPAAVDGGNTQAQGPTVTTSFQAPELTIGGTPSAAPQPVTAGTRLNVIGLTLSNTGNQPPNASDGNFETRYYLSTNNSPSITAGDLLLSDAGIIVTSNSNLLPGTSVSLNASPLIPNSVVPGGYHLKVITDEDNEVAEGSELLAAFGLPFTNDNITTFPVNVLNVVTPDLVVCGTPGTGPCSAAPANPTPVVITGLNDGGTPTPARVLAGGQITVSPFAVENQGAGDAYRTSETDFVLSSNIPVQLGTDTTPIIPAGQSSGARGPFTLTVPADTSVGDHNFIVQVDATNVFPHEADLLGPGSGENNDDVATPLRVVNRLFAVDDAVATDEDQPIVVHVLDNEPNPNNTLFGDTNTIVSVTAPTRGQAVITDGGTTITYTPNAAADGDDAFNYTITDSQGQRATATVTVKVNDRPTADAKTASTNEDTAKPIALTGSDQETAGADLTFNVSVQPQHGTLSAQSVVSSGSTITYTPNANYNGPDSFQYTVTDRGDPDNCGAPSLTCAASLTSAPATVSITVTAVNDPPVTANDAYSTDEDTLLSIETLTGVLANDKPGPDTPGDAVDDESRQVLTAALVHAPAHGRLRLNSDGSFTYSPDADYDGPDSFIYKACDNGTTNGVLDPKCTSATVALTVYAVNDAPVVSDETLTTEEDTSKAVTVVAADVDSAALTFSVAQPAHGNVTPPVQNSVGAWLGKAALPTQRNTLGVAAVNGMLYAVGGQAPSGAQLGTVEAYDPGTNTWTRKADMPTARGRLALAVVDGILYAIGGCTDNACGGFVGTVEAYDPLTDTWNTTPLAPMPTPRRDFLVGVVDGIIYAVGGLQGPASNGIDTVEAYDPSTDTWTTKTSMPTARGALVGGMVNGMLYAVGGSTGYASTSRHFFLNEAYDAATDTWATKAPIPLLGVYAAAAGNGFLYVFGAGNGAATEAYDAANDTWTPKAPMPAERSSFAAGALGGVIYSVGGSDGSGILDKVEAFYPFAATTTYTPNANYNGPDSFTYKANDGSLDSSAATVAITVTEMNDPPVTTADAKTTAEDTTLVFPAADLKVNDSPGPANESTQALTVTAVTATANTHGAVSLINGTVTYTPELEYNGPASFTYTVCDNGTTNGVLDSKCADGTVNVTVTEVNDPPIATDDQKTINEDTTLTFAASALTTNDSPGPANESAQTLTVTAVTATANTHGSVTLSGGNVTYTPDSNFNGAASFAYTVCDNGTTGGAPDPRCATGTVNVTVNPVNDAPIAFDDGYSTNEDTPLVKGAPGVLTNDTDVDSPVLSAVLVADASHGHVMLQADGSFTYTPNANFNGLDKFTYKATDGSLDSNAAIVSITVNPINDAPVAVADSYTTNINAPLALSAPGVLANDTDVDSNTLTAVLVNSVSNGTLTLNANGSFTYTPTAGFSGTDAFTYKANDGVADSNVVTVSINVIDLSRRRALVASFGANAVHVLDLQQVAIESTLNLGAGPDALDIAVTPDGRTALVTRFYSKSVTFLDLTTTPPTVMGTTSAPINAEDVHIATTPDGFAVVTDGTASPGNIIFSMNIATRQVVSTLQLPVQAQGITVVPGRGIVLVNDFGAGVVRVVGLAADGVLIDTGLSVSTGGSGAINVEVSPDGQLALAANFSSGSIGVLHIAADGTVSLAATVTGIASPQAIAFSPNGSKAYVYAPFTPRVSVLNIDAAHNVTNPGTFAALVGNAGPAYYGVDDIAVSEDGRQVLVHQPNSVTIIDPSTMTVIGSIPIPNDNDAGGIAVIPVAFPIGGAGDVALFTSASPTSVTAGMNVSYTVIASNTGLSPVTGVVVTDPLPAGTTFVSSTSSLGGCNVAGGTVTCAVGTLAPRQSAWITITVTANTPGSIANTATASANEADPNVGNNTATVVITVTAPNHAPTAVDDYAATTAGTPVTIAVLSNDSDPDTGSGDTLTLISATQGAHGTVSMTAGNTVTYTPTGDYGGPDSFTYRIRDSHGATATATVHISVERLLNNDFHNGLQGWVVTGTCSGETRATTDDAIHNGVLGMYLSGGGSCSETLVYQVALVNVDAQSSVRVRFDVKIVQFASSYTGPVYLQLASGTAPTYDQVALGQHTFSPGALTENFALQGLTSIPVGTWYSWTSDDLRPLIPAGTSAIRVAFRVPGHGVYGWAKIDNVKVITNDNARPAVTAQATPSSGNSPLPVSFVGTATDGDGIANTWWDFGNGPISDTSTTGGSTSTVLSPSFTYPGSRVYTASLVAEDLFGATTTKLVGITTANPAPVVSIEATPNTGPAPLTVNFIGHASDVNGTIASYAWTFGDGATSALASPSHIYAAAGSYTVTFTATDDQGAASAATAVIVATDPNLPPGGMPNGDFSNGLQGWMLAGNCAGETTARNDDAVHGGTLGLSLSGGGSCTPTKVSQVALVDASGAASVRVRLDVKMMQYFGYTGPVRLKVYAGTAPTYDQTLLGEHVFAPGSLSESFALGGTTTLPLGTWYGWTSAELKGLLPAGATALRLVFYVPGGGVYGWARIDNVKVVLDDVAAPVTTASASPSPANLGTTIGFTGSASDSDGIANQWWDFGDGTTNYSTNSGGTTSFSQTPSFTYPTSGTFYASWTAEDTRGAVKTTIVPVIVNPNQPPSASITATPQSGPAPLDVQFFATASDPDGSVVAYSWNFGDGSPLASGVSVTHHYASPGSYQVTLTVTDNFGGTGTAQFVVVVTGAAALANGDFGNGLQGWLVGGNCAGETHWRTDDAVHGGALGLSLSGGGSCTPTTVSQVALVNAAGASSVRLRLDAKMMDYFGYTGPVRLKVFAGTAPTYDQTLIGEHVFAPGTLAESFALSGTTRLPLATWYAWTSNDLQPLLPPGTTALRLVFYVPGGGVYGWARIDNVKIVLDDAVVPTASASASPSAGPLPLAVAFTGSGSDADGTLAGTWWDFGNGTKNEATNGGGTTSLAANPSFTYTAAGSVYASWTVEDDRGAARTVLVNIQPGNTPPVAVISATPNSGPAPLAVQFNGTGSYDPDGVVVAHLWSFGDGSPQSTASVVSHTFTTPGSYLVTLQVTDSFGATNTSQLVIVVQ